MAIVSGPASSILNIAITVFGRATNGSNTTLQDSSKSWSVNYWSGTLVKVTIRNADYLAIISSNTVDTLTFSILPNNLVVSPGDPYAILGAGVTSGLSTAALDSGTAAAGTNTTMQDTAKSWPVNLWTGTLAKISIAGVDYLSPVTSNTADTLTFAALAGGVTVPIGAKYAILASPFLVTLPVETIYNAAIVAAATFYSTLVDCQTAKRVIFHATSTLNQPCTLRLVGNITNTLPEVNDIGNLVNLAAGNVTTQYASIGPDFVQGDWHPYIGVRIITALAPGAGTLVIQAVRQV